MIVLYNSNVDLRQDDFNDQISSVIVTGGMWKVYEHIHFVGRSKQLNAGEYRSVHALRIGGDSISSVRMVLD